jgi:hypothetical protein
MVLVVILRGTRGDHLVAAAAAAATAVVMPINLLSEPNVGSKPTH